MFGFTKKTEQKRKIVFLERSAVTRGDIDFSEIEALGDVTYYEGERTDWKPEEIPEIVREAEILILNKTKVTREFIEQCPKLRCISILATGYNNIDIKAAKEHNVCVYRVPGYSTDSVAQLVFGFMLQFAGSLPQYQQAVRNGDWCRAAGYTFLDYPIVQLAGRTLGIIGYGNIGKRVANIAMSFGMRILVYTRTQPDFKSGNVTVTDCSCMFVGLDKLLEESDFVTLHCPLTALTYHMIAEPDLALMQPTAFLINTSRGAVVEEKALARALNEGRIAGAGIDVLDPEPMSPDCPLLTAKNCLITPHIGWAAIESRQRLIRETERNIRGYFTHSLRNRVWD